MILFAIIVILCLISLSFTFFTKDSYDETAPGILFSIISIAIVSVVFTITPYHNDVKSEFKPKKSEVFIAKNNKVYVDMGENLSSYEMTEKDLKYENLVFYKIYANNYFGYNAKNDILIEKKK